MNAVTAVALALLTVAAALCVVRALRPGTVVDRAVSLDGVASAILCGIAVYAVRSGSGVSADITIVGGLLGFLVLCTVARYVGRRGL